MKFPWLKLLLTGVALVGLEGCTWTQFSSPQSTPLARSGHVMAYDAVSKHVILFGGKRPDPNDPTKTIMLNDTWEWDGHVWTQLAPVNNPPVRFKAAMVSIPDQNNLLLFGGVNNIEEL